MIPFDGKISINCICWKGSDFAEFNGLIPKWPTWDEEWLGEIKPKELNRNNFINGKGVLVHFSYSHSKCVVFLETHTDFYSQYLELAKQKVPNIGIVSKKLFLNVY